MVPCATSVLAEGQQWAVLQHFNSEAAVSVHGKAILAIDTAWRGHTLSTSNDTADEQRFFWCRLSSCECGMLCDSNEQVLDALRLLIQSWVPDENVCELSHIGNGDLNPALTGIV